MFWAKAVRLAPKPLAGLVFKLQISGQARVWERRLTVLVVMTNRIPSILITDDDVDFRETLKFVFEPCGYRTLQAGDGEEALHILSQEEIDLLLLDMHMPKLTGLETLRRVKQIKSRLPCILLSAELDEQIEKQARRAQAFSVLRKPVSRQQLTTTVQLAIHGTDLWPGMSNTIVLGPQ